jgi:diguanylate cyclase (GGDEF)-like protein
MLDWTPEKKVSLPTPQTEEFRNTLDNRQIVFIDDPVQLLKYAIPCKYGPFVNKFQEALDITAESKSLFLPLIVERKTIGLLGLYGENLQEIDLKAGEIFNSQISIALENSRLLAEVQRLAITDELTGINNRRGLFELGSREFLISKRMNRPLSALMIDLDNFKDINDRYGHAAGDFTLHEIAKRISDNIREIDIIGRYGGEEFVVLLIGDNLQSSMVAAERIREAISNNKVITETDTLQVTVSIGVDELDSLTANLDALIKRADRALYIAKHNGRNRVATLMNLENSR